MSEDRNAVPSSPADPIDRPAWLPALILGVLTACFVQWAVGDRLTLTPDEGTFLGSAVRILQGEVPYRDFFANTGPGNFWLLAAIFRFAGISLHSAHLLLALDLGVLVGLTYWLAFRLAGGRAALASSALCAALFFSSPTYAVTNHRWDANAFGLAAIAAGLTAIRSSKRSAAFMSGVFAVLAAWVTPPVGLLAVALFLRLALDRRTWRLLPSHVAGVVLAAFIPTACLASQGGLAPMLESLFWNASHYSGANLVPYGFLIGGPAALFAGAHGIEWLPRSIFAFAFLLPAILPVAAAVFWLPKATKARQPEIFLLVCGGALVASNYPRIDLPHLVYVCPVFVVLAATWLRQHGTRLLAAMIFTLAFLPALAMCRQNLTDAGYVRVSTSAGILRVSAADAAAVSLAAQHVATGSSFFVFPYEPIFYFVTRGLNPTRYLWLQPGMMSDQDERNALTELQARPPEWILYRDLQPQAYLRVWPGADPARLRMPLIEGFIRTRYIEVATAGSDDGDRKLLKRR